MQHAHGKRANTLFASDSNFPTTQQRLDNFHVLSLSIYFTLSLFYFISVCSSDTIPGLSAFVDGDTIMSACGCGPSASSTGTTTGTTTPDFIG